MNYYNDNDRKVAQWLKNLISGGLIPPGDVDERSIIDVEPSDLTGYTQCHFFAGIGGWPEALRLAGWSSIKPVWTGSCPCQPFSVAGAGKGVKDKRHLWPEFCRLICECNPPDVFGEQVASKLGKEWLSGVRLDLEEMGYAVGAADLCAASIGAPHIRQRIWWVGHSIKPRLEGFAGDVPHSCEPGRVQAVAGGSIAQAGAVNRVANTPNSDGRGGKCRTQEGTGPGKVRRRGSSIGGVNGLVANTKRNDRRADKPKRETEKRAINGRFGPWSDFDLIPCADGKTRRIESGVAPLVDGVPGRVVKLRGYGNAIAPPLAAEFIKAAGAFKGIDL